MPLYKNLLRSDDLYVKKYLCMLSAIKQEIFLRSRNLYIHSLLVANHGIKMSRLELPGVTTKPSGTGIFIGFLLEKMLLF